MQKSMTAILILFTFSAQAAWDSSVIVGEWENYQYGYNHKYQKLVIKKDFSGTYFVINGDNNGVTIDISKDDFQFFDGFAVLSIDNNFKLLLSAWGTRATGNTKRLLGQLFIYTNEGGELKLINSEPVSYYSATDEGFVDFANKIKNAQGKYH